MRRTKEQNVTDLALQFLRNEGLETPLNEYRIMAAWPQVIGKRMAMATKNMFIRNEKLHVEIDNPVIRQELMMSREALVSRLNASVGARVITDIIIR